MAENTTTLRSSYPPIKKKLKKEEQQEIGTVEDFLEFNWEHRGMSRGSEGIPL